MKSFLLSLRFVIKRVFRLTAVNIVWLICFAAVIVAITVGMAVAPEIRGSDDYPFYLTTVPFITVLLFFGVSSLYSDIYVSVYIRTSGLYKCLRTRAVQVFLLIMSVAALIPAIIVTAVVNPSALPDFLLISAIIIVKSNMVYTLCKHMVYMLSITNEHKNELEMRAKPEWKVHFLCFASAKRGSFSIR